MGWETRLSAVHRVRKRALQVQLQALLQWTTRPREPQTSPPPAIPFPRDSGACGRGRSTVTVMWLVTVKTWERVARPPWTAARGPHVAAHRPGGPWHQWEWPPTANRVAASQGGSVCGLGPGNVNRGHGDSREARAQLATRLALLSILYTRSSPTHTPRGGHYWAQRHHADEAAVVETELPRDTDRKCKDRGLHPGGLAWSCALDHTCTETLA